LCGPHFKISRFLHDIYVEHTARYVIYLHRIAISFEHSVMMDINTHNLKLSVLLLQFFSLNRFLSCIIKLSSENTEVCLVCTLLPLILSYFFSSFDGTAVLSLHKGCLPFFDLSFHIYFNFAFNNNCSVDTRQSICLVCIVASFKLYGL